MHRGYGLWLQTADILRMLRNRESLFVVRTHTERDDRVHTSNASSRCGWYAEDAKK